MRSSCKVGVLFLMASLVCDVQSVKKSYGWKQEPKQELSNAKSQLQVFVQRFTGVTARGNIQYAVEPLPGRQGSFRATVLIESLGDYSFTAESSSIRQAEHAAAQGVLDFMKDEVEMMRERARLRGQTTCRLCGAPRNRHQGSMFCRPGFQQAALAVVPLSCSYDVPDTSGAASSSAAGDTSSLDTDEWPLPQDVPLAEDDAVQWVDWWLSHIYSVPVEQQSRMLRRLCAAVHPDKGHPHATQLFQHVQTRLRKRKRS
jgi:ribosomal protein S14